ncbi:MAG: PilT/PilU family type 4a pilus ATPase [Planctomycetes bacterium]|nr:PilT/PilU family type 4a pilus ATPase [Planctomycetota bacterium]MBL7042744.1 PilT/PilU family type 4a pilus ATPase [Pirellulaceae bacterium]
MDTREAGASDLHIKANMAPIVRVNSVLRPLPRPRLSVEECEESLLAILDEEQRDQFLSTNDLDLCYDGGKELGRFRTNYLREHRGMDAIFRAIPNEVPTFEELNLPEQVMKFTDYRVGVVLVTGPKGSGKTTTLAAMVDRINNTRAEHIITVEDPIEFVQPCRKGHVNQRQVGVHTKSFSNALRSALREAPDVIMVGEMRDLETTSLAITAAETGHLVLATLHTPDAIRTIGRVLDVFPAKEQPQIRAMLSESLRGIVSQQLLPSADGKSMVLALEILVNTQAIGHLIREEKVHQIRGLMQTGKQHGMVLMEESLVRLAREGRISEADAISRAEDKKMVQRGLAKV